MLVGRLWPPKASSPHQTEKLSPIRKNCFSSQQITGNAKLWKLIAFLQLNLPRLKNYQNSEEENNWFPNKIGRNLCIQPKVSPP